MNQPIKQEIDLLCTECKAVIPGTAKCICARCFAKKLTNTFSDQIEECNKEIKQRNKFNFWKEAKLISWICLILIPTYLVIYYFFGEIAFYFFCFGLIFSPYSSDLIAYLDRKF